MNFFSLSIYKPSDLELWISQVYRENGILCAAQLDIEHVADIFNISLSTTNGVTKSFFDDDDCMVLLNARLTTAEKRSAFFHELCHPLRHSGDQNKLPAMFVELQEMQAANFQLVSAMPIFMIRGLELPNIRSVCLERIAHEFGVTPELAKRRLQQIEERVFQGLITDRIRKQEELRVKIII